MRFDDVGLQVEGAAENDKLARKTLWVATWIMRFRKMLFLDKKRDFNNDVFGVPNNYRLTRLS